MNVLRLLELYTQIQLSRYNILKYLKLHQRKHHATRALYLDRCKTHGVVNGNAVRTLYFDGVALKPR